ncbi:hypothetical protein SEUCBS139899_003675 [Sporothrix eucalyptigena]|uniref:Uncharacterized protein n=1 Tax=Sporothrix eucalyptigena TaxID=1812306 RepID=A0ABP0BRY9_9PEZI
MASSLPSLNSLQVLVVALLAIVVAASTLSSSSHSSPTCIPQDQPNPIAQIYPFNATGLLNVTLAVVPIPLATARTLVPSKWPILVHVYEALFASLSINFPANHYPLLVQAGLDHDIQLAAYNLSISDFQRTGYEFPFVDRLGDNFTSFRWVPHQIITASNADAVEGSRAYGTDVSPADAFQPPCDAYQWDGGGTSFHASSAQVSMTLSFSYSPEKLPLALFRNMTNQPSFANGTACDNQIRLFDSAHFFGTQDATLLARPVKGSVRSTNFTPLTGTQHFAESAHGWQLATPFIENNYLDCDGFKGYSGVDLPGY